MRKTHSTTTYRGPHPPGNHRKFHQPLRTYPNYTPNPSKQNLVPTASAPRGRPNFIVILAAEHRDARRPDVNALLDQCKSKPEKFMLSHCGIGVGTLYFRQWVDALEAVVWFWESRLDGAHRLIPKLNSLVDVPSDQDELQDRLRELFSDRIRRLMEGEQVEKWNKKRENLTKEIGMVLASLRKPKRINIHMELTEREKRLTGERDLIEKRVQEFKSAMNCLLVHLEGKRTEVEVDGENNIKLFNFKEDYNWRQIHSLMLRECRRLEDGLPIYAYRRDILQQINCQQVLFCLFFFFEFGFARFFMTLLGYIMFWNPSLLFYFIVKVLHWWYKLIYVKTLGLCWIWSLP